jgi:hypothetical protein
MKKFAEPVKRELPSMYCHKCRRWVESQEKVNMFSSVDGARKPVATWACPECRGDAPAGTTVEAGAVTQADVSKDERLGPYRAVVRESVKLNPGGKTARADLACGHNICVVPDATKARCRKCRAKGGE